MEKGNNLSNQQIRWGLSMDENSFTNPHHTVNANTSSTKMSSTLAPNGDFLIFENTSAVSIDIELTIEEP